MVIVICHFHFHGGYFVHFLRHIVSCDIGKRFRSELVSGIEMLYLSYISIQHTGEIFTNLEQFQETTNSSLVLEFLRSQPLHY